MILENELSYFLELFLQYWLVPSDYVVADGLEEFILETRVMDELYKPSNQKRIFGVTQKPCPFKAEGTARAQPCFMETSKQGNGTAVSVLVFR